MDNLSERDRQAAELSQEIINLARNSILFHLRFMDRAIGNLRIIPDMNYGLAGCGSHILYSPWSLILSYRKDEDIVTRDLLHCILHNVFRHSITFEGIDRLAWDLAADIAVEFSIRGLADDHPLCGFLHSDRDTEQAQVLDQVRDAAGVLTAERIYSVFASGRIPAGRWMQWRELFARDQHDLWYGGGSQDIILGSDIDLDALWKDIAKRMQTELELFCDSSSAMTQNLREVSRARYTYTEFLRRFGIRSEKIRLSEEEFDNIYYSYGIDLYGNIPLIEPLEYRDSRNIRDFVIAIDTSGSVQGDIVRKFVQHTYDILSSRNTFDTRVNIYIIQCDDHVRDVTHITDSEDLGRYFCEVQIRGLGQTDFRPVFEYTDNLLREHRFTDLRGLIYFTDGMGRFPEKAPGYETAFIIHNDSPADIWVPGWAVRIELQTEQILHL